MVRDHCHFFGKALDMVGFFFEEGQWNEQWKNRKNPMWRPEILAFTIQSTLFVHHKLKAHRNDIGTQSITALVMIVPEINIFQTKLPNVGFGKNV